MKPHIELRKIKHSKSLSEETPAYTADVYVDGKLFCHVSNHGQGGCDKYYPATGKPNEFHSRLEALNKLIADTYKPVSVDDLYSDGQHHEPLPQSLELLCHQMLSDQETARELQRLLNRTIAFYDKATKQIRSFKTVKDDATRSKLRDIAKQKYPQAIILNDVPLNEALAMYREH